MSFSSLFWFLKGLVFVIFAMGFPKWHSVKESTCQCRRQKRCGFNPGSGRTLGVGNGNCSNILAWKFPWTEESRVHGITKSWTTLSTHTHLCTRYHCATDFGWGVVTMGHFQIKAFNCWYEFPTILFLVYNSHGKKKCSNARKTIWRVMDQQIAIWRTVAWRELLGCTGDLTWARNISL